MTLPDRLVDPDEEYADTLDGAARDELVWLWADLAEARRTAFRGCWSIECASLAVRIVALSRHVGAASWEQVDIGLITSGVYERIYTEAGLSYPPIVWEAVATQAQKVAERGRTQ